MRPETVKVQRILVATKYRFIGDTLLAVPLISKIAERWPEAEITLLTGAQAQQLMIGCHYIRHTICFDPYRKADEGFRRFYEVVKQVRSGAFDLAFVCNRSFHSALIAKLAGIPERIGWAGFQGRDCLLTRSVPYNDKAPEISSYLDLLASVSPGDAVPMPRAGLKLWLSDSERQAILARLPMLESGRIIGLQPGATHAEKRWPAVNYAEYMNALLAHRPDTEFLLLGGPDETSHADDLLQHCTSRVAASTTSVVGLLALRETLAALPSLDLFVAGDTAIRHAAMAQDTPTVALFGPTSVKKWGNEDPPRHAVLAASSRQVADIPVADVLNASLAAIRSNEMNTDRSNFSDAGVLTVCD